MKKTNAFLQKYNGFISIVAFGLMFVFALGMATPAAPCKSYQDTYSFYEEIMPVNNAILLLSIFGLLISALYFILRNHTRIIYYISNFVWYGLNFVYTLASAIVMFVGVAFYQGKYNQIPFDAMSEYFSTHVGRACNPNTPVFAIGYVLGALLLLTLVPYVLVLIDKVQLRLRYEANKKLGVTDVVSHDPKEAK